MEKAKKEGKSEKKRENMRGTGLLLDKKSKNPHIYIMKKNDRKKFSLSGGEKAFICQQASDLQMPALILMERARDRTDNQTAGNQPAGKKTTAGRAKGGAARPKGSYIATFVLDPDNLNLKVKGRGETVFEACMEAKKRAKESFARAAGFFPDKPRELLIDLIKHKQTLN